MRPTLGRLAMAACVGLWPASAVEAQEPASAEPSPPPSAPATSSGGAEVGLDFWPDAGFGRPRLEGVYSPVVPDFDARPAPTRPWALHVSLSGLAEDGVGDSAKLEEYREIGAWDAGLRFRHRTEGFFADVVGRNLPLAHRDLVIEAGRPGVLKGRLSYDQIPHNYAFGARTLHTGSGSGRLSIDDAVQARLQASASAADATTRARGAVAEESFALDVGHTRKKAALALGSRALGPVEVELEVARELRRGTRPTGGSFGLANTVEIPWPIDYETREVRGGVEYAAPRLSAALGYTGSWFSNEIDALRFDNPWRITDSSTRAAASNFAAGPSSGQFDLAPGNEAHTLGLTAALGRLPWKGRLSVAASRGWMRQDDTLLPYTVNTAVVPVPPPAPVPPFDATDPANLPASRVDARMDTALLNLRLQLQPASAVRVVAHYRYYDLDNRTRALVFPGFVREDAEWRAPDTPGAIFTNLPVAHTRRDAGVEGSVDLSSAGRLSLGYTRRELDREFREVARMDEDRLRAALDARLLGWAELRASYEHARRDASDYDFSQHHRRQGEAEFPVLPFLVKWDEADREQDRVQVLATASPAEALVLSASLTHGRNDYDRSPFGLLGDRFTVYAGDAAYALGERLSVQGSYSREEYRYDQAGRSWSGGRPGDPYLVDTTPESLSNWQAREESSTDTIGAGLLAAVTDRVRAGLAFSYSRSDGSIAYASPLGTAATDANAFVPASFPEVDDIRFRHFQADVEYRLGPRLTASLAYVWEAYDIADFNTKGFVFVPASTDGAFASAIFMGTLPRAYNAHLVSLTLRLDL
ncbi:MAG TPA: MtrB/PioB family decaheme-associated outer membrane protein [Vicinamibacteria bacterium]|jgi:MtrB/PioB family decaheme-associated outer membrane protein